MAFPSFRVRGTPRRTRICASPAALCRTAAPHRHTRLYLCRDCRPVARGAHHAAVLPGAAGCRCAGRGKWLRHRAHTAAPHRLGHGTPRRPFAGTWCGRCPRGTIRRGIRRGVCIKTTHTDGAAETGGQFHEARCGTAARPAPRRPAALALRECGTRVADHAGRADYRVRRLYGNVALGTRRVDAPLRTARASRRDGRQSV